MILNFGVFVLMYVGFRGLGVDQKVEVQVLGVDRKVVGGASFKTVKQKKVIWLQTSIPITISLKFLSKKW